MKLGRMPHCAIREIRDVFDSGAKHDVPFGKGHCLGYHNRRVSVTRELWKAYTHFLRWAIGRKRDLESGKSHLAHTISRLMIILENEE